MKLTDEGFFLGKTEYADSSLIVHLYTQQQGYASFYFAGGRKRKIQFIPLQCYQITFYKRKEGELNKLTEMSLTHLESANLQWKVEASALRFFMAEICVKCLRDTGQDRACYDFLLNQLTRLNDLTHYAHFPLEFLAQFTQILGIAPIVDGVESETFDLMEGDFVKFSSGVNCISTEWIPQLKLLFQGKSINVSHPIRREMLNILLRYYGFHLPTFSEPKSLEVLRTVLEE